MLQSQRDCGDGKIMLDLVIMWGSDAFEFHVNLKTEDEPLISLIDTDFL